MQNQNDDYDGDIGELDDEFYDEVLEDSFEEESVDDDYQFDEEFSEGLEDDFAEDEDWGDEDTGVAGDASLLQKEKKSGLNLSFNTIVIAGAVVVGLIVLGLQVTKKPSTPTKQKFTSALSLSGATDGPVFGDSDKKESEELESVETVDTAEEKNDGEQGFLFEPDVLDSMEMGLKDTPPMPSPISEEVTIEELEPNIEDVVLSPEMLPVAKGDLSEVPRAPENVGKTINEEIVLLEESPLISEEPLEEKKNGGVEEVSEGTLLVEPEVTEVVIEPDQKSQLSEASNLEKKIDHIVNRLNNMEVQMNQLQGVSESKLETVNKTVETLKKELKAAKSSVKAQSVRKAVSSARTVKLSVPKSSNKVVWELRAAQPGKAWVSQKGQTQMKSVVIGDTLVGVGRIQNILFSGGRWTVQGTSGKIRQ